MFMDAKVTVARNTEYAESAVKGLVDRMGAETFLAALGKVSFPLEALPMGKEDELVPVFTAGRIRLCSVGRGDIGRYTCLRRDPAGVIAVPLFMDDEGRLNVVLTEQKRGGVGMLFTELPAGGQKPSESIVQTAMREALEETGYRAIESTAVVVQGEPSYVAPGYTSDRQVVVQFMVEKVPGERSYSTGDAAQIKKVIVVPLAEAAGAYAEGRSPGTGGLDTKTAAAVMAAAIRNKMELIDHDLLLAQRDGEKQA